VSTLVIGGSRGIGLEIARAFARDGQPVYVNYSTDDERASEARALIEGDGGRCTLIKGDVATPEGCADIARALAAHTPHLDHLVHSAVMAYATDALGADAGRFAQAVSVNGMSLLYITQAVQDLLRRGSSVFYLSSRGGRMVVGNYAAIGVGKALAESLVRYLAVELAPLGIRINAIAPGIVETDAVRAVFGDSAGEIVDRSNSSNPSGRGVRSEDYTGLMRFLASPAAEYITGQTVFVNGGANLHA
jgi:NAD(P)-dependent dehydrogenase (short-subunit alcohol dehydrogenase family)